MKIILASQSPRRKELMELMGITEYKIMVSGVDETLESDLSIQEQSKRLAYMKAKVVFEETQGDRMVIGADTMVIKKAKIYGKPKNKQEAIQMLQELKNGKHQVITSLCVLVQRKGKAEEYLDYDIAEVYLKNMAEEEIRNWVDKDNPIDKAGAYAIQSSFGVFVEKIKGNYSTIIGLPIHKLYDIMKQYVEIGKIEKNN